MLGVAPVPLLLRVPTAIASLLLIPSAAVSSARVALLSAVGVLELVEETADTALFALLGWGWVAAVLTLSLAGVRRVVLVVIGVGRAVSLFTLLLLGGLVIVPRRRGAWWRGV